MKREITIAINAVLALVIILIILAIWLPAIYTSQWFQGSSWVKTHLLHTQDINGKPTQATAN